MNTNQIHTTHAGGDAFRFARRSCALCPPLVVAALLLASLSLRAQTLTQTFTLQNGWNAIYLEVTPTDGTPTTLFAGLPVASVWTRVDKLSSVDFIQDPAEATFNQPGWLKWCPPPQPAFVSDLKTILGQRAYLVKLTNGPVAWQVTGQPAVRAIQWVTDAWNLRGFPVASGGPPTFRTYFQCSTNHYDAVGSRLRGVYRLGANGIWALANPDMPMREGEACWVYCQGASSFTGPLELSLDSGDALSFDQALERINAKFQNRDAGTRAVTIVQASPVIAGLLAYQRFNATNGLEWADLPSPYSFTLTNGNPTTLTLGIRRSLMPGTNYATVLDVSDGQGTHYAIPVAAQRVTLSSAGLWVGSVTVNAVSEPHFGSLATNLYALVNGRPAPLTDPGLVVTTNQVPVFTNLDSTIVTTNQLVVQTTNGLQVPVYEKIERSVGAQVPTPTKNEFTMRVLLHVDNTGQARLLKEVVQMWRDGTYTNDANGYQAVDKPGTYVLLTRDALLSQFKGAVLKDGVPIGRRLSAIGFDFDGQGTNHMPLAGTFAPGQSLTGTIQISSDYPLNPFLHRYHPDHDNLDANFNPITDPAKKEAYAVTRQLEFDFAAGAAPSAASPDPAFTSMEGTYHETLTGLHKQPINVQGTFKLSRASFIAELNPSPIP